MEMTEIMYYHIIVTQPGGKKKLISNKAQDQILQYVIQFETNKAIVEKKLTYQALELSIYKTDSKWNRKSISFDEFIRGKWNIYSKFKQMAQNALSNNKPKVFVIMPIQGEKSGTQNEQRIYKEYDDRFGALFDLLNNNYGCIAIRIDKEHPLTDEVTEIKKNIKDSLFVIADLTDERPSCYFEAGFAEGFKTNIIYIASNESVINPGSKTKIHFDIHMHINFFSNLSELTEVVRDTIEKNKEKLFSNNQNII